MDDIDEDHSVIGQRGSYRRIVLLSLGLGIATLGLFVVRAPIAGHDIARVLLRGGAVPTAIGAALFVLLIGLIGRSGFRRSDADDAPRDPSWLIMGVVIAAPILLFSAIFVHTYLRASELMENGLPVGARLIGATQSGCGKTGCTAEIGYAFTPRGWDRPLDGSVGMESSHGGRNTEEYDYVTSSGIVPLMYDRKDPRKVMLFWRDNIQRNASLGRLVRMEAITIALVLAVLFLLIFGLWRIMRKRAAATDVIER